MTELNENWRPVVGSAMLANGRPAYEVSDLGRVRSWCPVNGYAPLPTRAKLMTPVPDRRGRLRVTLPVNGKKQPWFIYHLVLNAFVGPCPDGMEACHYPSSDLSNNRLDNLRWGTHAENIEHKRLHGTTVRGEAHPFAATTDACAREIFCLAARGVNAATLSQEFNVSVNVVRKIVSRKTYAHATAGEK